MAEWWGVIPPLPRPTLVSLPPPPPRSAII